jgi:hypothetical protein
MAHVWKPRTVDRFERAIDRIRASGDLKACVDNAIQLLIHSGMKDGVVAALLRDMEAKLLAYERAGVKYIIRKRNKGARIKSEARKDWVELRERLFAAEQKAEDYREKLLEHGIKMES